MASIRCLVAAGESAARPLLRSTRAITPLKAASAVVQQKRYDSTTRYARETTQIPDFSKYKTKSSESSNKLFSYFMVGTMGALSAAAAKATVQGMKWYWNGGLFKMVWIYWENWSLTMIIKDFLVNMSASADILAMAKVEVALGAIPEGKNVRLFTFLLHFYSRYMMCWIVSNRSLSSGEESQSLFDIEPQTK